MRTIARHNRDASKPDCIYVTPARSVPDIAEDARRGLLERPRFLSPKYFYDGPGSRLFDAICDTAEYYPTRTEDALLNEHGRSIVAATAPGHIVELGSGASRKTERLFEACEALGHECTYWPFDVCEDMLRDAAGTLQARYEWLTVKPLVGDYHGGFANFPVHHGSTLYMFLGGTVGNFEAAEAQAFLRDLCGTMRTEDWLLIGADRLKDPAVLNAAYNDARGITAQFNLNVLRVLNRELSADFDVDAFRHRARFDTARSQIEMHLVARHRQRVELAALDAVIEIEKEEAILTEISRKFTRDSLYDLLSSAGLTVVDHYEAPENYFSLVLARKG